MHILVLLSIAFLIKTRKKIFFDAESSIIIFIVPYNEQSIEEKLIL
jgi:hypothetical protein